MISTANITMQFGAKPLFENVSVKFGGGNRYGLIGANGCGKSTFMKILGDDLEPSGGQVMLEPNVRLGKLRQDQFAYEEFNVIDTVIMGHEELWKVKAERDRIYSLAEMTEEDGIRDWSVTGVQTCALPISFTAVNRYNRAPFAPVRPFIWTKIRDLHRQHHHAIRG